MNGCESGRCSKKHGARTRRRRAPEASTQGFSRACSCRPGANFSISAPDELSTGQGQRLLIALAIMHRPPVLLADEPTSALDAITQAAVLRLFQELNRRNGTAMLFISHDLLSVASMGHRVEILHEGRIVESGPPGDLFHAPRHEFTRRLVDAMPRAPGRPRRHVASTRRTAWLLLPARPD